VCGYEIINIIALFDFLASALSKIALMSSSEPRVKYSNQTVSFNTHVAWICFLGSRAISFHIPATETYII
jgi:hypothetical protein